MSLKPTAPPGEGGGQARAPAPEAPSGGVSGRGPKKYVRKKCDHPKGCSKRSFLHGLCSTHSKTICTEALCTTPARVAAERKCYKHTTKHRDRKKCDHADSAGQCGRLAVPHRTKCSGHMPPTLCQDGAGNIETQCKAVANVGTSFCTRHRGNKQKRKRSNGDAGAGALGDNDAEKGRAGTTGRAAAAGAGVRVDGAAPGTTGNIPSLGEDAVAKHIAAAAQNAAAPRRALAASAARYAADPCLLMTCTRAARGHYLCREHSGLYQCTARSAGGVLCGALTRRTIVGGTCAAHSKIGSNEKMMKGGFTIITIESTSSTNGDGSVTIGTTPVLKRQGKFNLVACTFSSDAGVRCKRNGYQAVGDSGAPYCKRHRIFTQLRTKLATFENEKKLDPAKLPSQDVFKVESGGTNWNAAVADKLGLQPDGAIRL